MAYLTYPIFTEITKSEMDEATFEKLLPKASDILDHITDNFYQKNTIAEDNYLWRVQQFKKALASQIMYFDEVGSSSYEGINKQPQSFSAGRTSVTSASRCNTVGANESKSVVAEEVYMHLSGTGLLYRGLG